MRKLRKSENSFTRPFMCQLEIVLLPLLPRLMNSLFRLLKLFIGYHLVSISNFNYTHFTAKILCNPSLEKWIINVLKSNCPNVPVSNCFLISISDFVRLSLTKQLAASRNCVRIPWKNTHTGLFRLNFENLNQWSNIQRLTLLLYFVN